MEMDVHVVTAHIPDKLALDVIATAMSNEEWKAELWTIVAEAVRLTGRKIGSDEDDDEPDDGSGPLVDSPPVEYDELPPGSTDLGHPRYGR